MITDSEIFNEEFATVIANHGLDAVIAKCNELVNTPAFQTNDWHAVITDDTPTTVQVKWTHIDGRTKTAKARLKMSMLIGSWLRYLQPPGI